MSRGRLHERLARDASLVARLAETWVHRLPTPNRLVLDVTRRCNLRCGMCRTWEARPGHELTPDEIGSLVADLPRLMWLDVTGGEPFLRRDIRDVFDAIAEHAPALSILHYPTNGWHTGRIVEVTERLASRHPGLKLIVTVSIDGPEPLHDRMRGVPGAFARAIETYAALRSIAEVEVHVGTTLTHENADALDDLEETLRHRFPDFDPARWHINVEQRSEHFFGRTDRRPVGARGLVGRHIARRGAPTSLVELMELVFLVNREFVERGEPVGMACQALRSAAFVSPEGDVYPCHVWDRPLGNVRQRSFAAIWRDAETLRAREDAEQLRCGGCFTPCEAYPALAGAPLATIRQTARRGLLLLGEALR